MNERLEAQLVDWDDGRGFGFARLPGGTERIFVHIKSLNPAMPRPQVGDQLEFEVINGRKGRPAAASVNIIGVQTGVVPLLSLHTTTAAILLILLQMGIMLGRVPMWMAAIYVSMSAMALVAYSWDKKAARIGMWRISERRLSSIDLFGGIIGGLLAQHMFAHKRSKASFQATTLFSILVHAAILGAVGSGLIVLT